LLRSLAGEGRTAFVSSHLMSEMENIADHLIVIGRGRLIADQPLAGFTQRSAGGRVRVRAPEQDQLARLLRETGALTTLGSDGDLTVTGATAAQIGELAARHGIALHELVAEDVAGGGVHDTDPGCGRLPAARTGPGMTATALHAGDHGPLIGDLARTEWTKLCTLRSTGWTLLAAAVAMIGFGGLLSAAYARHLTPGARATLHPAAYSLSGFFLAQLAIGVLGVLIMTGEHATGSIRSSLAAAPQRLAVLTAKAGVFTTSRSTPDSPPDSPPSSSGRRSSPAKASRHTSATRECCGRCSEPRSTWRCLGCCRSGSAHSSAAPPARSRSSSRC
jgi:hypothetical protein